MEGRITRKFLEENLFECPKVHAGFEHWYYTDSKKRYEVVICPMRGTISCVNYITGEEIEFSNRKYFFCTMDHLKRCIEFVGIKDEFDYSE